MLCPTQKKSTLFLLMLSAFIDYAGVAMVFTVFAFLLFDPSLHFFTKEISLATRGLWLGVLTALHPLFQFLSAPVYGALSDLRGRRRLMIISLLFSLVGYACAILGVWMENLGMLALYRILVGLGAGNCSLINAIVADISSQKEKARHFGYMSMSLGVGFTVAPFLSGVITRHFGYLFPFILPLILVIANLILVIRWLPETHPVQKEGMVHPLRALFLVKKAWDFKHLRALFLSLLFFSTGWSFFYEFAALYLKAFYDFSPKETGYFYGYSALFYSISAGVFVYPVTKWFEINRALVFTMFASGFLLLGIFFLPSSFFIWLYVPFFQIALAFVYPTLSTVISNSVSDDQQGEVYGIYHAVIAFAMAISPAFAGGAIGVKPALCVLFGGAMMLVAGIVNWLLYYRFLPQEQHFVTEEM
jgi:MFS transporter, DHA1 family, tetracycline resistance protein